MNNTRIFIIIIIVFTIGYIAGYKNNFVKATTIDASVLSNEISDCVKILKTNGYLK